jgi:very-short-patch-repair endonuclease
MLCNRCKSEFHNKSISSKWIEKNPDKFKLCPNCRKFRICPICEVEFHHKQNQTCSLKCSSELKERSFLESCGAKHNFYRNSKSRLKWEKEMMSNEGISNVFQRKSVKEKIELTFLEKYGVKNVSGNESIKKRKKETLKKTIDQNPNLFKENWLKTHEKFICELGYDPRQHTFGKASKESMLVFNELYNWCLEIGLSEDDIYVGTENKNEFFIQTGKKVYFYDFTIRSKKLIIEFHGIAFHVREDDPDRKKWRNPFTNEKWKTNVKKTRIKNKAATKRGFKILEIWSDVPVEINIKNCKEFINENKIC